MEILVLGISFRIFVWNQVFLKRCELHSYSFKVIMFAIDKLPIA